MAIGANKETAAAAVRSFLIWEEEFSRKGRHVVAEKLYQRASGLVEKTLEQEHPTMAEVLECYSDLLRRTHRSAEGIAMKKRAEAIWKIYTALASAGHTSWVVPSPIVTQKEKAPTARKSQHRL